MKVTIDKIGGFVGFSRFQVNSDDLSPEDQHQLHELVKKNGATVGGNALPGMPTNESTVNVMLENQEGTHVISAISEVNRSQELAELIQFVESRGKPHIPD